MFSGAFVEMFLRRAETTMMADSAASGIDVSSGVSARSAQMTVRPLTRLAPGVAAPACALTAVRESAPATG